MIRLRFLDGLRGVAALLVVLCHVVVGFYPTLIDGDPEHAHFASETTLAHWPVVVLWNPEFPVAIFFVLSGFVLAKGTRGAHLGLLPGLAVRRWIRLTGPILGTSFLAWLIAEPRWFFAVDASKLTGSVWLSYHYAWLTSVTNDLLRMVWQSLADIYLTSTHYYNSALWTMPTELWGSLGVFALYCLLPDRWPRLLALAVGLYLSWDTPYLCFVAGVALFELVERFPGLIGMRGWAMKVAGPGLLMLALLLGGVPFALSPLYIGAVVKVTAVSANPVLLMHRTGAVLILLLALLWRPAQRVLASSPCHYLGRVSFMIYLIHIPLLCSLYAFAFLHLQGPVGYNAATLLLLPAFTGVVVVLAHGLTVGLDEPCILLSRRVGARLALAPPFGGVTPLGRLRLLRSTRARQDRAPS